MKHTITIIISLAACATHKDDVARVRELSRMDVPPPTPVEPLTSDEVRAMLKQPLDADTAVRIALLNNREMRAQLRDMGVERGALLQAGLIGNPVFELEVLPERNTSLELRVEYDVTSLVLAPIRARAASFDLEAARYRAAGAVVQTGYDVRAAFYTVQAAEARLAIAKISLDASAAMRDAAEALFKAGNTRRIDMAAQTTAYEKARIGVAKMELEAADAREALTRQLGLYGDDTTWTVAGPLPDLPALGSSEKLETKALEASLDLKAMKSSLEGLARKAGFSSVAGWVPDIAVDIHALIGDPDQPGAPGLRFGGGVSVGVPLFDQRIGTQRSFEAQRDALLERYYGAAIALRSNVRETYNRLRSSHLRASIYRDTIAPAQANVMEQTLLQYNAMQVGVFELLRARNEQLQTELERIDTVREFFTARAALDALLSGRRVSMPAMTSAAPRAPAEGGH